MCCSRAERNRVGACEEGDGDALSDGVFPERRDAAGRVLTGLYLKYCVALLTRRLRFPLFILPPPCEKG